MKYETKKGWSINDTSTLIDNPHYKRYKIKKDKIKSKLYLFYNLIANNSYEDVSYEYE